MADGSEAVAAPARADAAHAPGGTAAPAAGSVLRPLGLFGLDAVEPVLLAALATEEPLLLIGPHGTAKSLLLTRIAGALGLAFRHYNASLLNFDDLVGFPVPAAGGGLDYVRTPASIWGAEAVIFDEISRCRPDIQNKLFPIIHERKVQGLALQSLRFRWAAMNPPDTGEDDDAYAGSEPLDTALADRFAFVVTMPDWNALCEADQLAIIRAGAAPPEDGRALAQVLARTRTLLQVPDEEDQAVLAAYLRALVALLVQGGLALSPRRAGMLLRSTRAVWAAAMALGRTDEDDLGACALLALRCGIPQRAQGVVVPDLKLLAAHREAWELASLPSRDPLRRILCAPDPLERACLALATPVLDSGAFSRIIADAFAQLPPGAREALVACLFEGGAAGRLNAAIAEQAAERYRHLAETPDFSETLHANQPRFRTWLAVKDLLSRLDPDRPEHRLHANALALAFAREELATPEDAERAFAAWVDARARLGAA